MGSMSDPIIIRDDAGDLAVTYEDMLKYHGRDFYGGVALAFKVLKLAFGKLLGAEVPVRDRVRLVVGFNPPGVIDALEFATRALTRQRLILDTGASRGPDSVFGRYYFEVHYQEKALSLWLKPDILPPDFTLLARKSIAGLASEQEIQAWKTHKKNLGRVIMEAAPEELLAFEELPGGGRI
jgi:hypothetical protein